MKIKKISGQFLIVSMIATFMTVTAFIVIYPILSSQINSATGDMDVYSATMLKLTPFFIMVSIILTIVFASMPMREG